MEDRVTNSVTLQQVSPCWLKSCKREKRGMYKIMRAANIIGIRDHAKVCMSLAVV